MTLAELLRRCSCVLFDFDGPICAVFSGVTDRDVSKRLTTLIDPPLPPDLAAGKDPFGILGYAASMDFAVARRVERQLTELEVRAVRVARPTESTPELMRALVASGRTVGVVSNNSAVAVDAYLTAHDMRALVSGIYARTPTNFTQLKPDPHLLYVAMEDLASSADSCVFIGDSVSDIQAAHEARVSSIAFANRPEKIDRFRLHAPDVIVTHVNEIQAALTDPSQ